MDPQGAVITGRRLMVVAAAAGLVLGIAASRFVFVGSPLSLVGWAVAGMVIGAMASDRRETVGAGAAYGLVLTVGFMIGGRQGDLSRQWATFVPFTAVLGLLGAACGAGLGLAGRLARAALSARGGRAAAR